MVRIAPDVRPYFNGVLPGEAAPLQVCQGGAGRGRRGDAGGLGRRGAAGSRGGREAAADALSEAT